jgi:putative phosphoribosyl transferase
MFWHHRASYFCPRFESISRDTIDEIIDNPQLRGRKHVFSDRADAGRALAGELKARISEKAVVLAIPSGGIPVASEISKELGWDMDLVIVRKLQIPWEPEAGFGAVSLSGHVILNQELVEGVGLTTEDIEAAKEKAMAGARARAESLLGSRRPRQLSGRTAVVVDDGLASGYTMLAAIEQVKSMGANQVVVAVPTGSDRAVRMVGREADLIICLNIRRGPFAVADAYLNWYDLSEEEAVATFQSVIG